MTTPPRSYAAGRWYTAPRLGPQDPVAFTGSAATGLASHGGLGRAGGGAELGGLESVRHHMQTVAVQGSPAVLDAVAG